MHRALGAVDQHRNAARMRDPRHLLHRHQRAEHVRHVGDRHHLGARRQQLLEFVDEEMPLVVDRRPFDDGALALAQEMPRHDVGMVLHDREHDLVAGLDALAAERIGDEIDRLGGVAGEDDLFLALGVEERRDLLARAARRPRSPRWRDNAGRDARWRIASCRPGAAGRARPAASAPRRRCRDRPAACRRPASRGSENPRGCGSRRRRRWSPVSFMSRHAPSARPRR